MKRTYVCRLCEMTYVAEEDTYLFYVDHEEKLTEIDVPDDDKYEHYVAVCSDCANRIVATMF